MYCRWIILPRDGRLCHPVLSRLTFQQSTNHLSTRESCKIAGSWLTKYAETCGFCWRLTPPASSSTERKGARLVGLEALKKLLADHFVGEATIVQAGGYSKSAKIIANSLPTTTKTRSGDLGELLATEYLNFETSFVVPIKQLRRKSDRKTAMHGNDVIGVDTKTKPVQVLKGECKS